MNRSQAISGIAHVGEALRNPEAFAVRWNGVENPETMLKQAVREMEAALASAMDSGARIIADERLTRRQAAEHRGQLDRWHHEAIRAVREGDDERARFALSRKSEYVRLVAALEDQLASAGETSLTLRREIAAMRVRLTEARAKLRHIIARKRAAEARREFASQLNHCLCNSSTFGRFERYFARVEQAEAEAGALFELGFETALPPEINADIEAELQSLKQQRPSDDTQSSAKRPEIE